MKLKKRDIIKFFVIIHPTTLPTADRGPLVSMTLKLPSPTGPALKSKFLKKLLLEASDRYSSTNALRDDDDL